MVNSSPSSETYGHVFVVCSHSHDDRRLKLQSLSEIMGNPSNQSISISVLCTSVGQLELMRWVRLLLFSL